MQINMTIKGQVTIPRDVRKAVGLVPGEPVRVELNDRGEAVVLPLASKSYEQRLSDMRLRIAEAQKLFQAEDQMPGVSADEFMLIMRGPPAEI